MDNIGSYEYAVGRVKSLEARLLEPSSFQRMIDAPDFDEALRFLSDGQYSGRLTRESFESALDAAVSEAYLGVSAYSPDPYFTGMFLAEYDFLKLKAFVKEAFLKSQGQLVPAFTVPVLGFVAEGELKAIAHEAQAAGGVRQGGLSFGEERKPTDEEVLKVSLKDAAYAASLRYMKAGRDPLEIDAAIDVAAYAYLHKVAQKRAASWALELIAVKADTANLMLVMRATKAGKGLRFITDSLVPGGAIPHERLIDAAKEGADRLRRVLESSPYWRSLAEAFERWQKEGSIRSFEMSANLLLYSVIRQSRTSTGGYVPVMGYLLMRQYEASIIRRILAGKAKALPSGFIRERLCDGNA